VVARARGKAASIRHAHSAEPLCEPACSPAGSARGDRARTNGETVETGSMRLRRRLPALSIGEAGAGGAPRLIRAIR
jgi:hypothetical protein